ncbi:hypothetical protein KCP75_15275 [Salmonella enterica subsp. enterica]|nr:hypothetical protein KCP75_15275 [Salmonella enterica subsp. enterica]
MFPRQRDKTAKELTLLDLILCSRASGINRKGGSLLRQQASSLCSPRQRDKTECDNSSTGHKGCSRASG